MRTPAVDQHLKTVDKMFRILDLFTAAKPEWTVAELSRASGFARTGVQRIVVSLEREGYLERAEDTLRYRVGISACRLGSLFVRGNPLLQAASEPLRALARDTGYPVYLGNLSGAEIVILAIYEGARSIRFTWSMGDRLPAGTTALGKAMLMSLPPSAVSEIVGSEILPQPTPRSIGTLSELRMQLDDFRPRGWTLAYDESLLGVSAVGAAVLDADGRPVGGISVSFLADPGDAQQQETLAAKVVTAAKEIGRRLHLIMPYSAERVN